MEEKFIENYNKEYKIILNILKLLKIKLTIP